MSKQDIDIEGLLSDYDWAHVFGEADEPNCDASPEPLPPEATIDLSRPKRADVVEIIAAANGENDGDSWVGIFRMRDGRVLVASGSCDYTGWD